MLRRLQIIFKRKQSGYSFILRRVPCETTQGCPHQQPFSSKQTRWVNRFPSSPLNGLHYRLIFCSWQHPHSKPFYAIFIMRATLLFYKYSTTMINFAIKKQPFKNVFWIFNIILHGGGQNLYENWCIWYIYKCLGNSEVLVRNDGMRPLSPSFTQKLPSARRPPENLKSYTTN